ncbi:hypothetical protein RCS94_06560 [Orbaceae bacterium ac157xtp]
MAKLTKKYDFNKMRLWSISNSFSVIKISATLAISDVNNKRDLKLIEQEVATIQSSIIHIEEMLKMIKESLNADR